MNQNIFEYIKSILKRYGVIGRILIINTAVYLFFLILQIIEHLYVKEGLTESVMNYFAAPGIPAELAYKPWTVFTHMITHYEFGHFILNMLVFFFTSAMFVTFFSERRLVTVYILGGLFAYFFHVGAYYIFPVFAEQVPPGILGASGSVMAIFMAVAFYRPSLKVYLMGLIPIPIFIIAALYIWSDLSGINTSPGEDDNIAHLAHLGGALFGALSIIGYGKMKYWLNPFDWFFSKFKIPAINLKRKPKMKVYQGGAQTKYMSDEEFNQNKKLRQDRLDAILDKVSKRGYDGLTQEEKDFLFNESQRK